jgi:hypothetical protein
MRKNRKRRTIMQRMDKWKGRKEERIIVVHCILFISVLCMLGEDSQS